MFGDSALSCDDDFDFAEDGRRSRLWRRDVCLSQRVLDYDEPVGSFDPIGDFSTFSYSGELKAFPGLSEEEENRSTPSMESSINSAEGLLAFDLDDDYEFSQAEEGLLPNIDINEGVSFPAEAVREPFESDCLLTIPSSCTLVKSSEKSADVDDCDDALELFSTDGTCVEPYAELNYDSASDRLSLAPSDGDQNAELSSESVCVGDVIPQSKDSHKIVPTRKQILIKVVRKFSSDSTDNITNCADSLKYKSHVDVSNAAFGTDMGGMKITRDDDSDSSMDKCLNRNAIQARINRAKKKAYIARLEEQVQTLNRETEEMKRKIDTFEEKEANLVAEIQYLNSILANDSMLANLISNINGINTAELSSPVIINKKRKADMINNSEASKRLKSSSSEGICLHVCQDRLSLELCHHCANSSKASIASDNNRYNRNFLVNDWWLQFLLQLASSKFAEKKEE